MVDCVSRWDVSPGTILHVDMHHDLGSGQPANVLDCGNFLPRLVSAHTRSIYWAVPASRAFLRKNGDVFVGTLPDGVEQRGEDGRFWADLGGAQLHLRAADDLPSPHECVAPLLVSYDMDFHYHRALQGPTTDPVEWLHALTTWLAHFDGCSIFVARSLRDGYAPPTYCPAAVWLEEWLWSGQVPHWSAEVWRVIKLAEAERTSKRQGKVDLLHGLAKSPPDIVRFWEAFQLYMAGEYGDAARLMKVLPIELRFHPLDELKVEAQHEMQPPDHVVERVAAAVPVFAEVFA